MHTLKKKSIQTGESTDNYYEDIPTYMSKMNINYKYYTVEMIIEEFRGCGVKRKSALHIMKGNTVVRTQCPDIMGALALHSWYINILP